MKRSLGFASVISVLLLVSMLFSSCGETKGKTEQTKEEKKEAVETSDPRYTPDYGNLDFGGTEIRMLVDNYKLSSDEFFAEDENGSIVNDAVFSRNAHVEKAINVKLNITRVSTTSDTAVGNEMERSIKAGDNLYDIVTIPGYRATQYKTGNFHNLKTVENLNLGKLYWTQGFNEIMGNSSKQYLASGAYSISMIRGMYVTVFNRDMMESWKLESPYDLVKNNQWTFEKQAQLVKDCYIDKNGDSKRDSEDTYGFAGGCYATSDPYWVSWNMKFLLMNNDGEYELNYDGEKFANIINMYHDFLFSNAGAYCVATGVKDSNGTNTTVAIANMFAAEKAMMATVEVSNIEQIIVPSEFNGNYGIVPLPKYNSDQEDYYTHTSDRLTTMGICSSVLVADLPMIGAVMECIASESYKTVFPAYYSQALSFRFLQDQNSQQMLDKVYSGIKIEGAFLYCGYFSMLGDFRRIFANGSATASAITANQRKWDAALVSLNTTFAAE